MITITLIRHGESTDNLKPVWAGWRDAPLTVHGMNQARALGEYLSQIKLAAIYTSDLKRAHATAEAIRVVQPNPSCPLTISTMLREISFGEAEGQSSTLRRKSEFSLEENYAQGIYPYLVAPTDKFPGGESMNDVALRADQAVRDFLLPHLWAAAKAGVRDSHIVVVSHGIYISQLVAALAKRDVLGRGIGMSYSGLRNTAWNRVTVAVLGAKPGDPLENPENEPLLVEVTHANQYPHLSTLKRQKGGIGSAAFDPKQQDIREFLGGRVAQTPRNDSATNDIEQAQE